jgi:photosystem II stability/assembly factor-like uncharacterized protein
MKRLKPRGWIGIVIAAALGLTGCGGSSHHGRTTTSSTAPATPTVTSAPTATPPTTSTGATTAGPTAPGGPVPAGTEATSITFISPDTAFVLGTAPCDVQPCSAILRTTDRGGHWVGLPAPRENVSYYLGDGLWGLRFADARNGYAFGQGLWETSDGGASWHKATPPAPTVLSLEAVQDRGLVAVAQSCQPGKGCGHRIGVYHQSIGGSWSAVGSVRTYFNDASISVHGSVVWVLAGLNLYVSTDGGGSFQTESQPCPTRLGQPGSISDDGAHVYLLCAGNGAAGSTQKYLYRSAGPNSPWTLVGRPPAGGDGGEISAGSDGSIVIATSSGASLLYRSADGGRTWGTALTEDDGGAGWSDLGFTTSSDAVVVHGPALAGSQRPGKVLLSSDGGLTWHPASF